MIDPKDYPRRLIGERRVAPADAVDRLVVTVNLAESPLGWLALGALSARWRFDAAMNAVGPGLSDVLWRVVCEGEGLTEAERGLSWPARAGKLVLGLALDRLVMHYGTETVISS